MEAKKEEQDLSTLQILGALDTPLFCKTCQMIKHWWDIYFAVRWCSNGVISSLERFFSWYGCLVASHPWTAILICLAATVGGGLGLLRSVHGQWIMFISELYTIRFYEESDAARLVIPPHSDFRKNIDWIDNNFPREVMKNVFKDVDRNLLFLGSGS